MHQTGKKVFGLVAVAVGANCVNLSDQEVFDQTQLAQMSSERTQVVRVLGNDFVVTTDDWSGEVSIQPVDPDQAPTGFRSDQPQMTPKTETVAVQVEAETEAAEFHIISSISQTGDVDPTTVTSPPERETEAIQVAAENERIPDIDVILGNGEVLTSRKENEQTGKSSKPVTLAEVMGRQKDILADKRGIRNFGGHDDDSTSHVENNGGVKTATSVFINNFFHVLAYFFSIICTAFALDLNIQNERRAVLTYYMRDVFTQYLVRAPGGRLAKPEQSNNKLVYASGDIHIACPPDDKDLGVEAEFAICLMRKVEVLQWRQKITWQNNKPVYNYEKCWSEKLISSQQFRERKTHLNPITVPVESKTYFSKTRLGNFQLTPDQITRISEFSEPEQLTFKNLREIDIERNVEIERNLESAGLERFKIEGDYLVARRSASGVVTDDEEVGVDKGVTTDRVGDIRISYFQSGEQSVTVLAQQITNGDNVLTFRPFNSQQINAPYYDCTKPTDSQKEGITSSSRSVDNCISTQIKSYFDEVTPGITSEIAQETKILRARRESRNLRFLIVCLYVCGFGFVSFYNIRNLSQIKLVGRVIVQTELADIGALSFALMVALVATTAIQAVVWVQKKPLIASLVFFLTCLLIHQMFFWGDYADSAQLEAILGNSSEAATVA